MLFTDFLGLKWKVCIRSSYGHSWIYAKDLDIGEEHTYGRWRKGYGGNLESGVCVDSEKGKDKYKGFSERCIEVDEFVPTINEGYGLEKPGEEYIPGWHDRYNNCVTYACEEWKRVSGEGLSIGWIWHAPEDLMEEIEKWNECGGNPHCFKRPPGWIPLR